MTLGKVVNPKESVETRCHGLTDLCLWDYDVKHYLVIVVWGFFGNLTEGEKKKKKFQVWHVGIYLYLLGH